MNLLLSSRGCGRLRTRMVSALVKESRPMLAAASPSFSGASNAAPIEAAQVNKQQSRGFSSNPGKACLDGGMKKGQLVLEDGTTLHGYSFGDDRSIAGEIVFNTGMVGYPESLTDPSYRGQILVMTYPMIGNYGVPSDANDLYGLREFLESDRIHVRGLIVSEYCLKHSHWNATRSLSQWLKEQNIPALWGVDTRMLTKKIREKGAMLAKIITDKDVKFDDPNKVNLVAEVAKGGTKTYGTGQGDVHILAVDCGMKTSIVRRLVQKGATVTVVPWDHDIVSDLQNYDGLFVSNGPGDPKMCKATIANLKTIIAKDENKPIFGICLGHQLLSLAAGADTKKMRYGHRGHNQPCIDLHDNRCYITSQNHGYVVDTDTLNKNWEPAFVNANDGSSEGIIHKTRPYFSVQFHPEAKGGPEDTDFLFDRFLTLVRAYKKDPRLPKEESAERIGQKLAQGKSIRECMTQFDASPLSQIAPRAAKRALERPPKKVIILGSGGLQIGQAGEFDYSGSQAIKALKEEGIQTILMNPNIATVQTAAGLADKVYFLPVTVPFVEAIIEKEKPDGILLQFGGQTALNCGVDLATKGILARNNVQVLGTSVETIIATEDRDEFAAKLTEIGEPIARSVAATTVEDAIFAAEQIGYPVIVRAAFSLGGLGSGFAEDRKEMRTLVRRALSSSPQVLVEKAMRGWKEVEYEVVRDADNNCITVCNMENFDPLGIHTGDSIVVAPSQTMDDHEYHMLRTSAIRIVRHLGVVGECNVQYALHPTSREYCVIEVNPRLSRSSALASKATGYPLAFVAAKLALGQSLPQLRNRVTEVTSACFEPSLDYIVTKIPRWDVRKFNRVSSVLGSSMKSVGEVMAIGRTFEESFQKALRMVDSAVQGFQTKQTFDNLDNALTVATDQRVFAIAQALQTGYSVDKLHDLTKIDRWFLHKLQRIHDIANYFKTVNLEDEASVDAVRFAKKAGFSDIRLSKLLPGNPSPLDIRNYRKKHGIIPVAKKIDTLAAEYPANTNYLYVTYNGTESDVEVGKDGIAVLGGGSYCIGNSVEFDYTAVSCIRTLRKLGEKTIMINYNPETVSTDYDESDRLYFEELSFERVMDIIDHENVKGVVVSVGGQIPNNLAMPLHRAGVPILGTHPTKIDTAEDRKKFSSLCDEIGVDQPEWQELKSVKDAFAFSTKVGYPVLVRPSYVLSGAAMRVVRTEAELEKFLALAVDVSQEHPVVVSKFIEGAKEIEMDGVGRNGEIVIHAIHEHIENAGVHSGDASLIMPPKSLPASARRKVAEAGAKVVKALEISGPFNCQFIVKGDIVKIIECNVRASRSFPFVSKILGVDFIEQAARIFVGKPVDPKVAKVDWSKLNFVGVKVANFSFTRLLGADPILGVEMASTGEVACYGDDQYEAFLKALLSRGGNFTLPTRNILLMTGEQADKEAFLPSARKLVEMGYRLFGTTGTARHLEENGVPVTWCAIDSGSEEQKEVDLKELNATPNKLHKDDPLPVIQVLKQKGFDLLINFPIPGLPVEENERRYSVRRSAVDYSIPLLNNRQLAEFFVESLANAKGFTLKGGDEYTHAV